MENENNFTKDIFLFFNNVFQLNKGTEVMRSALKPPLKHLSDSSNEEDEDNQTYNESEENNKFVKNILIFIQKILKKEDNDEVEVDNGDEVEVDNGDEVEVDNGDEVEKDNGDEVEKDNGDEVEKDNGDGDEVEKDNGDDNGEKENKNLPPNVKWEIEKNDNKGFAKTIYLDSHGNQI
jgi:hypothetical protein